MRERPSIYPPQKDKYGFRDTLVKQVDSFSEFVYPRSPGHTCRELTMGFLKLFLISSILPLSIVDTADKLNSGVDVSPNYITLTDEKSFPVPRRISATYVPNDNTIYLMGSFSNCQVGVHITDRDFDVRGSC